MSVKAPVGSKEDLLSWADSCDRLDWMPYLPRSLLLWGHIERMAEQDAAKRAAELTPEEFSRLRTESDPQIAEATSGGCLAKEK
jgi:hypothetical protein